MDEDFPDLLTAALIAEIKAAMGRADIGSSRELGRRIGESSQYVSMRLDGGNPRTGKRVDLNVNDIYAIAKALGTSGSELVRRAERLVDVVWENGVTVQISDDYPNSKPAEVRFSEGPNGPTATIIGGPELTQRVSDLSVTPITKLDDRRKPAAQPVKKAARTSRKKDED